MRRLTTLLAMVALLALTVSPASATAPEQQSTDVLAFADLSDVGNARLTRTANGVVAHAQANGIRAGVYTMWWVVWNTPEGCFEEWACLEADLFNPDAGLAIGYAGGAVVGPNEKLTIAAELTEGRTLEGFPYPEFGAIGVQLPETSLVDSEHAEIHLVFRSHEELIPGMVGSQINTFNGGCVYEPPIDGSEPAYGTPGPHTCSDEYFSIFPSLDTP